MNINALYDKDRVDAALEVLLTPEQKKLFHTNLMFRVLVENYITLAWYVIKGFEESAQRNDDELQEAIRQEMLGKLQKDINTQTLGDFDGLG